MSVIGDDNFTNITKKQIDCENGIILPEDKYMIFWIDKLAIIQFMCVLNMILKGIIGVSFYHLFSLFLAVYF